MRITPRLVVAVTLLLAPASSVFAHGRFAMGSIAIGGFAVGLLDAVGGVAILPVAFHASWRWS